MLSKAVASIEFTEDAWCNHIREASLNSLEIRFEYVKSSPKHIFATLWSQFLGFLFSTVTALLMSEHWSSIEQNSLTRLLRNVLGCLPSDASVERLFNKAGDIQRPKRARISSENLQNLLLNKCNEEWNFFYTDVIFSIKIAIAIANSEA